MTMSTNSAHNNITAEAYTWQQTAFLLAPSPADTSRHKSRHPRNKRAKGSRHLAANLAVPVAPLCVSQQVDDNGTPASKAKIPSERSTGPNKRRPSPKTEAGPRDVPKTAPSTSSVTSMAAGDRFPLSPSVLAAVFPLPPGSSRHRPPTEGSSSSRAKQPSSHGQPKKRPQSTGDYPNILWGAVPMDHLRLHPHFVPLPPPTQVRSLSTLQDVNLFRQDSWQWDALHSGRMTTSQAAAALGFLEPSAAQDLDIPRSLQKGSSLCNIP